MDSMYPHEKKMNIVIETNGSLSNGEVIFGCYQI